MHLWQVGSFLAPKQTKARHSDKTKLIDTSVLLSKHSIADGVIYGIWFNNFIIIYAIAWCFV
jgi:hypothetical protein